MIRRTQGIVPCPVALHARAHPDAPALVGTDALHTYADLDASGRRMAAGLREAGVERGTYVGLSLANGPSLVALLVALWRCGAVACPVSTRHPAPAVSDALERVGARVLVTRDPALREALGGACLDPDALERTPTADEERELPRLGLGQAATVVFTSGSTGAPKAALHTYGNHHYSALGSAANIPLGRGDRWLLALPLYHVGGLAILVRAFTAGAAVALAPPGAAPPEVMAILGVTHASLVSTQLVRWLRGGEARPSRLRAILLGGSAMPAEALEEAAARGLPIHTSYGLTEMTSQVTTTPPGASPDTLRTSGLRLPHRALRIGDGGEILVRGATLFAGYVERGRIDRAVDAAGWFHTRDLGRLDDEGRLHVLGRMDNRFVSGGENIQPEEVEAALLAVPGVEGAVVVSVADPEFGARPVAFVRGETADASVLRAALEGSLARFKIPIAFFPWPEDGAMKPDRGALRRAAAARLGRGDAGAG